MNESQINDLEYDNIDEDGYYKDYRNHYDQYNQYEDRSVLFAKMREKQKSSEIICDFISNLIIDEKNKNYHQMLLNMLDYFIMYNLLTYKQCVALIHSSTAHKKDIPEAFYDVFRKVLPHE
jgi:hypothetical protein